MKQTKQFILYALLIGASLVLALTSITTAIAGEGGAYKVECETSFGEGGAAVWMPCEDKDAPRGEGGA